MHCDYPQGGSLTVPERDISAIIAFGVLGRGVGSGKCLIPGSILASLPSSPFSLPAKQTATACVRVTQCVP